MKINDPLIPRVAERLRALADENRLRLLVRLRQAPANVSALTADLGIAQASVSKHLAVLRQAGLVEVRRVGAQAIYEVADASVFDMCQIVCDGVARHLKRDQALLRSIGRNSFASPPKSKGARK